MPRHVSARAKCPGICFLCLAGKEGDTEAESTPFEEMHAGAKWKATIMQEAPWTDLPHVMQGLPWVPGEEASFLKTDLWHNWHNGIGKIWLACSFVMLATLNVLQGGSVDSKFEELTGEFLSWAQRAGISPYLRQLNRDTFSFQTNNSDPQGSWSKAAATTQLMLFLSSFCDDRVEGRTADPLLTAIATCRESLFVKECFLRVLIVTIWIVLNIPKSKFCVAVMISGERDQTHEHHLIRAVWGRVLDPSFESQTVGPHASQLLDDLPGMRLRVLAKKTK